MDAFSLTRAFLALVMVGLCHGLVPSLNQVSTVAAKYPLEVHQMFRDRLERNRGPQLTGSWSAWSPWSTCSRTCGGGITSQIRHCISRPLDTRSGRKKRRRRQQKGANQCVGLYKRYHLCNTQNCPTTRDFRAEQCALYNSRPFRGKVFNWEPFFKASEECALNCRAAGMDFYATLNKTVVDGTSCNNPFTFLGKPAPKGTAGVCVDGHCKTVGLSGVIGSSADEAGKETCCVDMQCRTVSGLFTMPHLTPGYFLVAQVPKGACRLTIQQLKHTRNFIALRYSNSSYFLNGDWKYSPNGDINAAGTKFLYRRQDTAKMETVGATGVLETPVDIMLLYQQTNPGLKYEYMLPLDDDVPLVPPRADTVNSTTLTINEPKYRESTNSLIHQKDEAKPNHHRRNRIRRKFAWKISGLTVCTKPCGGGTQSTIIVCVRENTQIPAYDRRCSMSERPQPQTMRCNPQPCPARWGGIWGTCSASCGVGVQRYELLCQQEVSHGHPYTVAETACTDPRPAPATRPCFNGECDSDNDLPAASVRDQNSGDGSNQPKAGAPRDHGTVPWDVGQWSQCSVSCGTGFRQRLVSCPTGRCRADNRPHHSERCEPGTCVAPIASTREPPQSSLSSWLFTEWSQCSVACGTGLQTRYVACINEQCQQNTKPSTERACSSDKHCGEWFTGPWSRCPDSCSGNAKQKREVMCIVKLRGSSRIVADMTCSDTLRPKNEQECAGTCVHRWFTSDWTSCDGKCPGGVQSREVRCLDQNGVDTLGCPDARPERQKPCFCNTATNTATSRIDIDVKHPHDQPADPGCVDKFPNCHLAVQARLCQYPYYRSSCCYSCSRAPHFEPIIK